MKIAHVHTSTALAFTGDLNTRTVFILSKCTIAKLYLSDRFHVPSSTSLGGLSALKHK